MTNDNDKQEFQAILAALGERELTDWERERLWALLEDDESRLREFTAHCFLGVEMGSLTPAQLADAGIERSPGNVVTLPGLRERETQVKHSQRFRTLGAAAAVAALLVAGIYFGKRESKDEPRELVATAPKDLPATVASESQAQTGSVRRASLSLDDPNDEAVALSGAAALANSRTPRGGLPEGSSSVPETISFNHHVRPILSENCFFCHGPDEQKREADLRLDTREGATEDLGGYAAIVPGKVETSEAWQRILSDDPDSVMPPPDSHRVLSAADREILKRWIEGGAVYDPHWAFMSPVRPAVPAVAASDRVKNPIDAFILQRLEVEGLAPNPAAAARVVLRRLSLDLTGLPPAPAELAAFEKAFREDPDAAVAASVERLLDSPHYGERMALPWLDAARYSDSNGFQQDGNRHQWPWRDWVVKAYHENMPFDRFTVEQIAGDLLPEPTQEQIIATAFNRNHMLNGEGGAIREEQRINNVIDRVDATATTWLGLTMACAQCHTHKYDPITHDEYFQFFAFFNNLPETGVVDQRSGQGCAFGSGATVQVSRPWLNLPTDEQNAEKARLEGEIKATEERIASLTEAITAPRTAWEASFTPAELENRTRFPGSTAVILRLPEDKRNPTQKRDATEFFLLSGNHENPEWMDLGKTIKSKRDALRAVNEAIVQIMVMEENPADKTRETFVLTRGDYQQPAAKVTPGTPAFLLAMAGDLPANRLGLAKWLTDPKHPLTARVIVNRLWQQFFGIGIVKTSEDFGVQGELPVHPELLDWLAVEFVESGWDVQHLVKLIVTSATYRQDATFAPEKTEIDPVNRLLSRGTRARLPAMLLRDQALAVSGLLIPEVGGVPVYPKQPEGLWEEFSFGKISYPSREEKEHLYRRSLYTFWRRTSAPPNMFDSSARQVCTVKPSTTNTPLHALTLLNDTTYVEAARALARRMMNEAGAEPAGKLAFAFELATGRLPDERERQLLLNGYERSLNEFASFTDDAIAYAAAADSEKDTPIELAAYTRMAQVILNLDETLNRP